MDRRVERNNRMNLRFFFFSVSIFKRLLSCWTRTNAQKRVCIHVPFDCATGIDSHARQTGTPTQTLRTTLCYNKQVGRLGRNPRNLSEFCPF